MWEGLPAHGDGLSSARCLQPKMCLPNFVFAAEFRLQGRTSHLQRSIPEPRTLSNSVFGPNFVFRTNFVFTNEFRLQRAPNRISSSWPIFVFTFRLRAQFELQLLANNFVFKSFGMQASRGGRSRDHFAGSMQTTSTHQSLLINYQTNPTDGLPGRTKLLLSLCRHSTAAYKASITAAPISTSLCAFPRWSEKEGYARTGTPGTV